jgi:hypothetical protein
MKTIVVTLNINNYEPAITAITYPKIKAWCLKIDADFAVIDKIKYGKTAVLEKFQIVDYAKGYDFAWFIDSDALVSIDNPPWHEMVGRDLVLFCGMDMTLRWKMNDYFRRCRNWKGSACTWLVGCSSWTIEDLWRLPDDYDWSVSQIYPLKQETRKGDGTLIDDYTLSSNIARFGLHCMTLNEIQQGMNIKHKFFHHLYNLSSEAKLESIKEANDTL